MAQPLILLKRIAATATAGCLLAAACVGAAETADREVIVINKGVGGHASTDGLKRFQRDVVDVEPDWLIVYFGINDAFNKRRRAEPEIYRKNMQAIVDRARTAGITNIILVTPNPVHQESLEKRVGDHPAKDDLNGYLLKYDAIVRELATRNDLSLIDLRALCDQFGGGADVKESLIRVPANGGTGDGVHLTAEGYRKFAELFVPIFKDRIKPGDVVVCFGDSITYGAHMKGAGGIHGDTYPAWLSVYLNQLARTGDRQSPPPPVEIKGTPKNGDMEIASDRVRPDFWNIWNVKGRQEGDCRIARGQGHAGNALKVINENPEFPAYLVSHDTPEPAATEDYTFSFQYRGSGQIRPVITFYAAGNKALGSFPSNDKSNPWRQGTSDWRRDTTALKIPTKAVKMRASFRVKGTILLDDVRFATRRPGPDAARPEAAAELKNEHLSVQLRAPADGGGVISIRAAGGTEFINRFGDGSLWQVTLRHLPTRTFKLEEYAELSLDPEVGDGGSDTNKDGLGGAGSTIVLNAANVNATCKLEESPGAVKLSWKGIDIGEEEDAARRRFRWWW